MLLALLLRRLISLKHRHTGRLQSVFQDAFAHFTCIHKWQDLNGGGLWKGRRDNRIHSESGWCDCFEETEPEMTRGMWRRNPHENEHTQKEKERFGRSKIIVTLSLDSTHYFSIQCTQCWGDMAEIQLQNTFDSASWDEAVDLQCHTVSA